jgi:hypothetical protein
MVVLASARAARHIRRISYTQPSPFSKLSAYHLSTFTGLKTAFLNLERVEDDEEVGPEYIAVPQALSDALKHLSSLSYLSIERYGSFADTDFSLARHLPQLQELLIPNFPSTSQDNDLLFIHPSPPALLRLEIGFDVFTAQALISTAGTVQQLLIGNRIWQDWDLEPLGLFEELKRAFKTLAEVSFPSPPFSVNGC